MADAKPIIVIKKKGGHAAHHGGAWKIAYADFVTAMMCFFMVMWLVNTASVVTKENIASYFRRPGIFEEGSGTPLMIGQAGILEDAFTPAKKFKAGTQGGNNDVTDPGVRGEEEGKLSSKGGDENLHKEVEKDVKKGIEMQFSAPEGEVNPEKVALPEAENIENADKIEMVPSAGQQQEFQQTAEEIKTLIAGSPELQDLLGVVDVKLEADGLNIEIIDTEKTSMFLLGSAKILGEAEAAFGKLASIISKLDNRIDIVGHTDAKPYARELTGYSNWELSTDRANTARRVLQKDGIDSTRINSVIGMADRLLKKRENPLDPSNRRISLKIRFNPVSMSEVTPDKLTNVMQNTVPLPPLSPDGKPTSIPTLPGSAVAQSTPPVTQQQEEPEAEAHSFTPKELIKASKKQRKDQVRLPSDKGKGAPFTPGRKDKIFDDMPVIGPGDGLNF
ncbi:MAG: flagellar motor protein MotB [bacterium]|nr:flagellar motor protein MotB [bacterium]